MRSRRQTGGAHGFGTVHPRIIERSKGSNHGDAKRFLPTDEIARKDAPGALRVANAHHAGKPIDGRGQLGAILKNFASESPGEFDAARTAVVTARAIRYVSPTFEKHAAARALRQIRIPPCGERRRGFLDYVEAPFQADEVMPLQSVLLRDFDQRLRTMAGAAHKFFVRQRSMTDPESTSSATSSNSVAGGKHGERNSNACLTPLIFGPRLLPIAMMVLGILWVVRRLIVTRLQENFHDNF